MSRTIKSIRLSQSGKFFYLLKSRFPQCKFVLLIIRYKVGFYRFDKSDKSNKYSESNLNVSFVHNKQLKKDGIILANIFPISIRDI